MELTTLLGANNSSSALFMMSKIQNLNGTHNILQTTIHYLRVVYDVKDTKFEWNSQHKIQQQCNRYRCL